MRIIWIIAINTFREIIRDRVLYGIAVFAVLLIGISLALGQLSFAEQARISADFGLTAIHVSAIILSIFIGSTLVYREIDKKTIMTLLARPITRLQFVLGKCLGLTFVTVTAVLFLAGILALVFVGVEMPLVQQFPIALFGVLLESILLLGITVFFSSFASPMMVVAFSMAVFLIGHWVESLDFFIKKSPSEEFRLLAKALMVLLPNLERFNWRPNVIYLDPIAAKEVGMAAVYSFSWFGIFILFSVLIFTRRDFG
jgi:ABC-type transport system involved in multi-copper enzyme maturation permease subunit